MAASSRVEIGRRHLIQAVRSPKVSSRFWREMAIMHTIPWISIISQSVKKDYGSRVRWFRGRNGSRLDDWFSRGEGHLDMHKISRIARSTLRKLPCWLHHELSCTWQQRDLWVKGNAFPSSSTSVFPRNPAVYRKTSGCSATQLGASMTEHLHVAS